MACKLVLDRSRTRLTAYELQGTSALRAKLVSWTGQTMTENLWSSLASNETCWPGRGVKRSRAVVLPSVIHGVTWNCSK